MQALKPTSFTARIVWLGHVADRDAALASDAVTTMAATFAGPQGEAHGGLTRPSCSRVLQQFARGTEIRNVRQFSIVSAEDLAATAAEMGVDRLDPAWLGATMMVEGLADFTHLPPSSRLQAPSGATLVVDMENRSCMLPAPVIEKAYPGRGKLFKSAARDRRGVTAWVEREGDFQLDDVLTLHIPDQPVWLNLEKARAE
ncbi:MOSC domain-containing protein [Pseudooceanicola aestuarii]|uniref:MOSC domain-containing protein n=1 Tax=Pseudooceanicola aestuarii TaxID=2697319 RepID=UPI0013CFCBD0|nr:sulfurase [Pseudooceanicola aestuarii]